MSERPRSAGFLITASSTGRVLLMLRSMRGGSPSNWATPGGRIERGAVARQAAQRKLEEETGVAPHLTIVDAHLFNGYQIFYAYVVDEFEVDLDSEHVDAAWCDLDALPRPLHRDVQEALAARPEAVGWAR